MMLTREELRGLAAETRYQPGPATTIICRPLFWTDRTTAQQVFLEMITAVHDHAPETITTWLTAACTGLAARHADDGPGQHGRSLAEEVAAHVHADDELHSRLVGAAEEATRTH